MVFEGNDGGVDYKRALLHSKRWSFYVNGKKILFMVGIRQKLLVLLGRRL